MGHDFMATALGPVMKITEHDAHKLAVAWCNWRQYYAPIADSKSIALGALVLAAWTIEFPRVSMALVVHRGRQAEKAKEAAIRKAAKAGPNVVSMPDGIRGA